MRLVITGSQSFIGRQLLSLCDARGLEHTTIDALPDERAGHRTLDIRSPVLADAIPDKTDALIHLAAVSRDQDCRRDPAACLDVNVAGTLNVVRAAERRRVPQVIFASSEWVYGEVANAEVQTEESPIDVQHLGSEYAVTKVIGERLLWLASLAGPMNATVLRFGIVYGPRPGNWSAVENLFHAVRTQDPVEVKGSLDTARRFIHVADIASGILSAVGRTGFEVFNLSGDSLVSLRHIIETSAQILGHRPTVLERDPAAISIRNPSNDKARRVLRWEPALGLTAGLATLLN